MNNEKNKKVWLKKCEETLRMGGRSEVTIKNYRYAIIRFLNRYDEKTNISKLTTDDIIKYFKKDFIDKGLSAATYNVNLAAVRFFYLICFERSISKVLLPNSKLRKRFPKIVTKELFLKIINNEDNLEHKCWLLLSFCCGAKDYLKQGKIDIKFANTIHRILLDSVRGNEKEPGKIRNVQNWVGPKGCTIEEAIFVPLIPEEVPILLDNLFQYMNDAYIDPTFINMAISHSQFETIHVYRDGNGRLGRALIPIQLAILTEDEPILFLSEIIELYKPSYYRYLNESRKGNMLGFIKFFLQCIIDQCNNYIAKINRIKQIYNNDMKRISKLNSTAVYRMMPVIMNQVVFTKKEVAEESLVSRNTVSTIIDKLVDMGILVQDSTYAKLSYRYDAIYNVFVGREF